MDADPSAPVAAEPAATAPARRFAASGPPPAPLAVQPQASATPVRSRTPGTASAGVGARVSAAGVGSSRPLAGKARRPVSGTSAVYGGVRSSAAQSPARAGRSSLGDSGRRLIEAAYGSHDEAWSVSKELLESSPDFLDLTAVPLVQSVERRQIQTVHQIADMVRQVALGQPLPNVGRQQQRLVRHIGAECSCIPSFCQHQITPKTSRHTRCSMSMFPNVSINGRIRSSGQLGRWWYSISPCRNNECVRRFTVFAFNQRS